MFLGKESEKYSVKEKKSHLVSEFDFDANEAQKEHELEN